MSSTSRSSIVTLDGAEARIFAAHDRLSGIVEDAHAGRVFKNRRAVAVAKFARVRTEWCDLDVLRPCSATRSRQRKRENSHAKVFKIHAPFPVKSVQVLKLTSGLQWRDELVYGIKQCGTRVSRRL